MVNRCIALGLAFAAALGSEALAGPVTGARPVVVELFTSQGCSDCPSADQIVIELAKRKDVIALSLPITYWDMLGWKDTFASLPNTKRQHAYAKAMNRSGVYTPQMVVDGVVDVVGNQRERVLAAITARNAQSQSDQRVELNLGLVTGRVEISIGASHAKSKQLATIWVMRTKSAATVNVLQGENKNRQLNYANLVLDLKRAGEWSGEAMKIDLPAALGTLKQDGIAVILQDHDYGEVLAAAAIPVPPKSLIAAPQ